MNGTILIVDDEERLRNLIEAYLRKDGYNVIQAENGADAIKTLKRNQVHLVVLDVMMPVMDGWAVLNEMRKFTDIPVIMLTAKSEDEDKLLGFEFGTDVYLTKPVSPKIVSANVKALMKRTYHIQNNSIKRSDFDGLYIDEESHRVTVNESEVYLSPKEFELLSYLVRNRGIVLNREKILDAVWGIDYYGELRTVDTHVKRLREKLGEKAYLISTVRGSGYKFEVKNEV
ncbi:response regulator transcription factor [Fonticella tunisiensis]|uniref:Stage 0 sporulation protein A homolog n=1 Tax=Fonticella tunisiensis TaxID=1096341 RepID=A0A4R7KXM3_9CLOT|nr:response regulator transcription factor [Fonticella tunisiensis]TDT63716.1 DNA-binding response OmpR family regulator [Fonticella tunisiensis]